MNKHELEEGRTIVLSDGRKLGFIERGDPEEKVVFYLHGWPCSRFEMLLIELFANIKGVRMIAIDRPGIGLSDFKKKRTILDLADDIIELADFLEIDKFSILGLSGGAPYAHGCAFKIPDRLNSVGVVSGLCPFHIAKKHIPGAQGFILKLARFTPWIMGPMLNLMFARLLKSENQEKAKKKMKVILAENLPEPDKKLYDKPGYFDATWKDLQEAFINGSKGAKRDVNLYVRDWGFELRDIPEEVKFFLWHGEMDEDTPIGVGKAVSQEITHSVSKFYPNEGHMSTLLNNFQEIISTLVNG